MVAFLIYTCCKIVVTVETEMKTFPDYVLGYYISV